MIGGETDFILLFSAALFGCIYKSAQAWGFGECGIPIPLNRSQNKRIHLGCAN